MVKCVRCGAETVEGKVYLNVPGPANPMAGGLMSMPGISMGGVAPTAEEGLMWREKTGEKKGFLFKSEGVRTMAVKGRRCTGCGRIELYAGDDV